MNVIKNILTVILFTTLTYGLVVAKTFAYCCGECHQHPVSHLQEKNDSCCGEVISCCGLSEDSCCESDHNGEPVERGCAGDPCRSEFVQFDWSPVTEFKSVIPTPFALNLFYENYLLADFVLYLSENVSKVQLPLIVQPPPREYLSSLNVLII